LLLFRTLEVTTDQPLPRCPAQGDRLGLAIVRLRRHLTFMAKSIYRIVPQSIISYGVEITEIDKPPRVLLTCSTEAMAEIWIAEIRRLRATKANGRADP